MSAFKFLPVFHEDPFLAYRPFPAEGTFTSPFIGHWHEAVASFVFYVFIQAISGPIARWYLGETYTSLNRKTRINFDIHVVSMVQCVISLLILLPMWNHPLRINHLEDPESAILGYYPYGGFVSAISVGYFMWDILVCAQHFSLFGVGFLFHGVAAAYVFGCSLIPYCLPWVPAFLLFELSTPFVNINWFASRLPAGTFSNTTVMVNGLLLLITFFTVRIVWGFYAVSIVAQDMLAVWNKAPVVLPVSILAINVLLDVLNVYWFYKMVLIAKKKAFSTNKNTKKID